MMLVVESVLIKTQWQLDSPFQRFTFHPSNVAKATQGLRSGVWDILENWDGTQPTQQRSRDMGDLETKKDPDVPKFGV